MFSLAMAWLESESVLFALIVAVGFSFTLGGVCGITVLYPKARSFSSEDGGK